MLGLASSALVLGLGGSCLGQPTSSPSLVTTQVISPALPQLLTQLRAARSLASSALRPLYGAHSHSQHQYQLYCLTGRYRALSSDGCQVHTNRVAGSAPLLSCLQIQLSCAPDNRASSCLLPNQGIAPALLCAVVNEEQG